MNQGPVFLVDDKLHGHHFVNNTAETHTNVLKHWPVGNLPGAHKNCNIEHCQLFNLPGM